MKLKDVITFLYRLYMPFIRLRKPDEFCIPIGELHENLWGNGQNWWKKHQIPYRCGWLFHCKENVGGPIWRWNCRHSTRGEMSFLMHARPPNGISSSVCGPSENWTLQMPNMKSENKFMKNIQTTLRLRLHNSMCLFRASDSYILLIRLLLPNYSHNMWVLFSLVKLIL